MYAIRLLVDCAGMNPEFKPNQPVGPENMRERVVPAGTELKSDLAYVHCLPDAVTGLVRAEPMDDITREKVQLELDKAKGIRQQREQAQVSHEAEKAERQSRRARQRTEPTEP